MENYSSNFFYFVSLAVFALVVSIVYIANINRIESKNQLSITFLLSAIIIFVGITEPLIFTLANETIIGIGDVKFSKIISFYILFIILNSSLTLVLVFIFRSLIFLLGFFKALWEEAMFPGA